MVEMSSASPPVLSRSLLLVFFLPFSSVIQFSNGEYNALSLPAPPPSSNALFNSLRVTCICPFIPLLFSNWNGQWTRSHGAMESWPGTIGVVGGVTGTRVAVAGPKFSQSCHFLQLYSSRHQQQTSPGCPVGGSHWGLLLPHSPRAADTCRLLPGGGPRDFDPFKVSNQLNRMFRGSEIRFNWPSIVYQRFVFLHEPRSS